MSGIRFAVLVLAVLVAGHDSLYLATYGLSGYQHGLASSGHGAGWTGVCIAVLLAAGAIGLMAAQRSLRLNQRLRQLGAPPVERVEPRRLVLRIVGLWLPLLAAALAVFAVQENVEHALHHGGHLPLADVLYAGEYTWTLPIFGLVALAAAAIGTVAMERIRALARAVRHWERRRTAAAVVRPRPVSDRLRPLHDGRPYRGRAPPRFRELTTTSLI